MDSVGQAGTDAPALGKLPLKQQFKIASSQKRQLDDQELPVKAPTEQQGRLIAEIERADTEHQPAKQVKVAESMSTNLYSPRKPRVGPQYQAAIPPLQPRKPQQQQEPQQQT